ncbi:uncharacterized protein LOC103729464 [Nannospalax galili]|uniref:uncharacterized protein LOC103729464 n=1 Tax=Nannospalax galili TaxID=1026970 RepID=UPI00111C61AF|nr:uncharacterized protein LOC103729464 [Nannospalax galili]
MRCVFSLTNGDAFGLTLHSLEVRGPLPGAQCYRLWSARTCAAGRIGRGPEDNGEACLLVRCPEGPGAQSHEGASKMVLATGLLGNPRRTSVKPRPIPGPARGPSRSRAASRACTGLAAQSLCSAPTPRGGGTDWPRLASAGPAAGAQRTGVVARRRPGPDAWRPWELPEQELPRPLNARQPQQLQHLEESFMRNLLLGLSRLALETIWSSHRRQRMPFLYQRQPEVRAFESSVRFACCTVTMEARRGHRIP